MASQQVKTTSLPPTHFAVALFPCVQLLDLAGPIDIINLLSMTKGTGAENVSFTFIASTLEPIPTKPIPPKSGAWTYDLDAFNGNINTSFNQYLLPDTTFDAYLNSYTSNSPGSLKPIDVLIIPGGLGTRINRIDSKTGTITSNVHDLQSFISKVHPHITHSIITICTGADVLAQTTLLNHRRATTNMTRWSHVVARNPHVTWLARRRYVVSPPSELPSSTSAESDPTRFQKTIYTSAGISAGIDVMLHFVSVNFGGVEVARRVARQLEYEWREIEEGEVDPYYDGWDLEG